jgi:DNA mismatch repair protein MutS
MVEMTETANILNNATAKSLVLMDEVGRGTSTFDGLSLAWSAVDYLANQVKCNVLFATHYFELTLLADELKNAANVHLTATEHDDSIVFLHKVHDGAASQSYGLQVAQLAGVPRSVIQAAKNKLAELELSSHDANTAQTANVQNVMTNIQAAPLQADLFGSSLDQEVKDKLTNMNLDETTPKQALDALYELQELV